MLMTNQMSTGNRILTVAQILSGLLALALFVFAAIYLFNPAGASAARGLEPIGSYGMTSIRGMAAVFVMMGIMTAIGTVKRDPVFLAPAAIYFLASIVIRIIGIFTDGADPTTIRVLIPATILFIVAEFALQVFKRANADKPA